MIFRKIGEVVESTLKKIPVIIEEYFSKKKARETEEREERQEWLKERVKIKEEQRKRADKFVTEEHLHKLIERASMMSYPTYKTQEEQLQSDFNGACDNMTGARLTRLQNQIEADHIKLRKEQLEKFIGEKQMAEFEQHERTQRLERENMWRKSPRISFSSSSSSSSTLLKQ